MLTKQCPKCRQHKDFDCFSKSAKRKDGKQLYCKKCKAAMDAVSYKRNPLPVKERKKLAFDKSKVYVKELLENSKCVDCGELNWVVLEFDHLDNKFMGISIMMNSGYSLEAIKAEIAKCEIVCANCHRIRTFTRANSWRIRD